MTRVLLTAIRARRRGRDPAALANPAIDLVAITTVGGNQTLERTTENARRVLALARREDVPVAAGADRPLVRPLVVAPDIHGASGLDGADLPEPTAPVDPRPGVDVLVAECTRETARSRPAR